MCGCFSIFNLPDLFTFGSNHLVSKVANNGGQSNNVEKENDPVEDFFMRKVTKVCWLNKIKRVLLMRYFIICKYFINNEDPEDVQEKNCAMEKVKCPVVGSLEPNDQA